MGKPTIRFEGYTDDWEQRKLGELVGIYDGVHQTPDYQDSGIMFLSVENIATLKSEKYISEEVYWDSIAWLKTAGFIYIEELIAVLEKTRPFYNTYEEVLVHELLPYLEKMNIKLKNNPNRK